jgi:Domain of unknown function (DUF4112)
MPFYVIAVLVSLDLILLYVRPGPGGGVAGVVWRGFRIELMVGLIPIIGPIWANSLSGRVVAMAEEAELPATLTAKMSANIAFDFLVSIPSSSSSQLTV